MASNSHPQPQRYLPGAMGASGDGGGTRDSYNESNYASYNERNYASSSGVYSQHYPSNAASLPLAQPTRSPDSVSTESSDSADYFDAAQDAANRRSLSEHAQAIVAQEMNNVQTLKRLSLGALSTLDPDIPASAFSQLVDSQRPRDGSPERAAGARRVSYTSTSPGSSPVRSSRSSIGSTASAALGSPDSSPVKAAGDMQTARFRNFTTRDSAIVRRTSNTAAPSQGESYVRKSERSPTVSPTAASGGARSFQAMAQQHQQQQPESVSFVLAADQASQLLWVPAHVHPEVAPQEWKSFVQHKVAEIREQKESSASDGATLSPQDSAGSLRRHNSRLSRQIRSPSDFKDGADVLDKRKSQDPSISDLSNQLKSLGELESLAMDPIQLAQTLNFYGQSTPESLTSHKPLANDADEVVLSSHTPSLRRSTRTQYNKSSRRKRAGTGPSSASPKPISVESLEQPVQPLLTKTKSPSDQRNRQEGAPDVEVIPEVPQRKRVPIGPAITRDNSTASTQKPSLPLNNAGKVLTRPDIYTPPTPATGRRPSINRRPVGADSGVPVPERQTGSFVHTQQTTQPAVHRQEPHETPEREPAVLNRSGSLPPSTNAPSHWPYQTQNQPIPHTQHHPPATHDSKSLNIAIPAAESHPVIVHTPPDTSVESPGSTPSIDTTVDEAAHAPVPNLSGSGSPPTPPSKSPRHMQSFMQHPPEPISKFSPEESHFSNDYGPRRTNKKWGWLSTFQRSPTVDKFDDAPANMDKPLPSTEPDSLQLQPESQNLHTNNKKENIITNLFTKKSKRKEVQTQPTLSPASTQYPQQEGQFLNISGNSISRSPSPDKKGRKKVEEKQAKKIPDNDSSYYASGKGGQGSVSVGHNAGRPDASSQMSDQQHHAQTQQRQHFHYQQQQQGGRDSLLPGQQSGANQQQQMMSQQMEIQLPYNIPAHQQNDKSMIMMHHRYPVHIERAIYRLSHLKLANPRRPLAQQVLLSNFMYAYLNLINHGYQQQILEQQQRMMEDEIARQKQHELYGATFEDGPGGGGDASSSSSSGSSANDELWAPS